MEDFVEIDLDRDGKVLAQATDKIALIDADTLAYTSCLNAQQQEALLGDEFYTQEELEEIYSDPNYDADNACIWTINLDMAYQTALDKLQKIFDKTGCREAELHFSAGKENFRFDVCTSYKANRTGRAPTGLAELKQMLCDNFTHTVSTKWEADDIVVYKKKQEPEKYVLVAVDKDLIYSLEGQHFNYYESAIYNIDMKWVDVDADTAMKWPYIQALIGDTVDNIKGVKGIGKAKAPKILAACKTELQCWEAVVAEYEKAGMGMMEAVQTMQLVSMNQFDGEKIVLWDPRNLK